MGMPLNVLIIEDSKDDAELILRELRSAAFDPESERVDNAEDLRRALGRKSWQVIICDHAMPGFDSFGALEIVKDHDIDLPFIVVSGAIVDDVAVKTMKAGAHDYLKKDNLARLAPVIERELRDKEERRQRKKAEVTLAAKSALLETTFETMGQGLIVFDANLKLSAFNHRYVDIVGLPPDFLKIGMTYEEVTRFRATKGDFGDTDVEEEIKTRLDGINNLTERSHERTLADGTVYIFHRKPMPGGGFMTTFTDITERKRAEQQIAEKSTLLETTLENMSQGFTVLDADLKFLAFNQKSNELRDYPPGFIHIGMPIEELYRYKAERGYYGAGDVEAQVAQRMEKKRRQKSLQQERVRSDGTVVFVQRELMPDGGQVTTYTDITERKRAERAMEESEDRLRRSVLDAPNPVMIHAEDGEVIMISKIWTEITGYTHEEIPTIEKWMEKAYGTGDISENRSRIADLYGIKDSIHEGEYHLTTAKGELRIWDFRSSPLGRLSDGRRFVVSMANDVTERNKAEEALAEKSELLETTLNNIAQGFCVYDANQKLVAFNKQYIEMAGFPEGFIHLGIDRRKAVRFLAEQGRYGKGDIEDLVEDRMTSVWAEEGKHLERQRSGDKYYIFTRKLMPDGGFVGTYTDITERKQAEQLVAEKSTLLEMSLENMSQGIVVYDQDFKLRAFNEKYIELMDLPKELVWVGAPLEEIFRFQAERGYYGSGEVEDLVRERLQTRRSGVAMAELERILPNGKVGFARREPMPDGGYVTTYTDITERKQAEIELKTHQIELAKKSFLLETTLENISQAFCVYDADNKLAAYNQQFNEMFGYPAGFLRLGLAHEDIIRFLAENGFYGKGDVEKLLKAALIRTQDQTARMFERSLPDGTAYIYNRKPMPDGGYVITYTDISERKRAEDLVRDLNESLEEKVEDRTAELKSAQEGLLRAERLAALGQLTGTVAHELRNPLGAVSATAKTIELKNLEAGLDLGKMFARMDRGIQRCDNIITELLDFARAKGLEAEPTPLDSWIILTLEEITIPQGITLNRNLDAKGMVLDLDRDRLRRALINVVDNACQAMGDDDGELTVSTEAMDGRVVITITDTGPGIPENVLPKIFEPLFSTKQFGVGLGLPTVRQIMEEHGGGFDIANQETAGTRATLWLPLALSREAALETGRKPDQETEKRASA